MLLLCSKTWRHRAGGRVTPIGGTSTILPARKRFSCSFGGSQVHSTRPDHALIEPVWPPAETAEGAPGGARGANVWGDGRRSGQAGWVALHGPFRIPVLDDRARGLDVPRSRPRRHPRRHRRRPRHRPDTPRRHHPVHRHARSGEPACSTPSTTSTANAAESASASTPP